MGLSSRGLLFLPLCSVQGHTLWLQHRQQLWTAWPWRQLPDAERKPKGNGQKKWRNIRLYDFSGQVAGLIKAEFLVEHLPQLSPQDPAGSVPVSSPWALSYVLLLQSDPRGIPARLLSYKGLTSSVQPTWSPVKDSSHPQAIGAL